MPAKRRTSDDLPGAIALGRAARGWNRAQLARASGLGKSSISDYERGVKTPTLRSLHRIAAALGVSAADLFELAAVVRRFQGGPPSAERAVSRAARAGSGPAPDLGREIVELLLAEVQDAGDPVRARRLAELAAARGRAPALWARLEPLSAEERRALVLAAADFHDAAFCELLCERSVEAAGDSAARALQLAELAVLTARNVAGAPEWRSRLEGYARTHFANALRVSGSLPRAAQALARAADLWRAGAADDPGLLNEARVLEIEASLRRDRRHLPEALALLDRALAIDRWGETPSLLIGKAKAVEESGDYEQALALLVRAAAGLDGERDPRRLFFVRVNVAVNLCHLGRYAEAERMLPDVRSRASTLGKELERLRVAWLEGMVAAGRGRAEEAVATLGRVRDRFVDLEIAYGAALVTLQLAEVHASQGRTAEVKHLARESLPIFRAQGVHREARVALEMFRQAAEREAATARLLRQLIVYLYRAQQNPELRFEPPAH
jgi:transcriptional regulator with XRE-family HTH domain